MLIIQWLTAFLSYSDLVSFSPLFSAFSYKTVTKYAISMLEKKSRFLHPLDFVTSSRVSKDRFSLGGRPGYHHSLLQ